MRQIKIESISEKIEIDGEQAKHLIYSLRSKVGEKISVIDKNNQRALFELSDFTKEKVFARLIKFLPPLKKNSIHLAISIPKKNFDEIIRQATEIGVSTIQPLITERTVARPSDSKQERWQRIAKEAAEQSGALEPIIKSILPLNEFLNQVDGQIIFCNECEKQKELIDVELSDELTLIIGCEGGFSEDEAESIKNVGALSVTLGEIIFKVDTAAIFSLATLKCILKQQEKNFEDKN